MHQLLEKTHLPQWKTRLGIIFALLTALGLAVHTNLQIGEQCMTQLKDI